MHVETLKQAELIALIRLQLGYMRPDAARIIELGQALKAAQDAEPEQLNSYAA